MILRYFLELANCLCFKLQSHPVWQSHGWELWGQMWWSHRAHSLEILKQGSSKGQTPVWLSETEPHLCEPGEMSTRGIAINCRSCFPSNVHTLLWSRPASEWRLWTQPYACGLQWCLYSGVYTVLTLDQQCWPFMLQSCVIALVVVCGWWPSGYTNVCWVLSYPFVDKWMSVHVLCVMGCCHRGGSRTITPIVDQTTSLL